MNTRPILLNPGPGTTSQSVKQALLVDDICPREQAFGDVLDAIAGKLLEVGRGSKTMEAVLLACSGTGAVESILTSAIGPKHRVLILTNGAYGVRMKEICERYGIPFQSLFRFAEFPDQDVIREHLSRGGFTHLAMAHHETSTGMMNPVESITRMASEMGVATIVDAMSSFGAHPFDLDAQHIDYLASSSNKCIQGMAGLGVVLFRRDRLEELKRSSRSYYLDLYAQWESIQNKRQLRFTPPVQVCYAFLQALQETLEEGVEARAQRYHRNWKLLYDGMLELGFKPFLPLEQESRILCAFHLSPSPLRHGFNAFHDALLKRGITVYPGVIPETETFRMAVIGDLHPPDMDYVIQSVRAVLSNP